MNTVPQYSEISQYHNRVKHTSRSKVIYSVLLVFFVAATISIFFISTDVNIQTSGIITTINRQGEVYTSVYGQLSKVFVKENDFVNQGDTLFTLDKTQLNENWQLNQKSIQISTDEIADLTFLTQLKSEKSANSYQWKTQKYKQQYLKLSIDQKVQQEQIERIRKEYERQTELFENKVISRSDHEKIKYDYENIKLVYEQLTNNQLSTWQNELSVASERLLQLKGSLVAQKKEREKYAVLTPFAGHVQQLLPIKRGSVVLANQKICTISPADNLLVETYISPSDIGFLTTEQPVKFRIDAFNANRWGMATGTVKEIANDITVEGNEILGFRALCEIDSLQLHYKGRTAKLKKGMTLTANFMLTRRTLAQLLFDDVSDWLNPNQPNLLVENE